MIKIHLSSRLLAVLNFIPAGSRIADIGSDHAHLPCRALQEKIAVNAIAGEVRIGPFRQSQANVKEVGMTDTVSVRMGDGLDVISPGEVDSIVIAGMGGELITEILERGKEKLAEGTTLILQPNIRESLLRRWLSAEGWRITDEAIVEEAPHFYEVIQARRNDSGKIRLTKTEQMMGPALIRNQTSVFRKKWLKRSVKLCQVLDSLERTKQTDAVAKKKEACRSEIQIIKSVLKRGQD